MGDLDSSSQPVPKTRSCDNLLSTEGECDPFVRDKRFATNLSPQEIDARLAKLCDGVDLSLRRAKIWSKYAKDVMTYIEKRCSAEAEHARNLVKLAQTMRPILKEESFLPFQSIYYMALDQDFENAQTSLTTCTLLQGYKFIEPLTARRNEHEKYRKQIKETWHRELKRMHESVTNLRKAKSLYLQRQQDYEKAKESALRAESSEGTETSKVDKKRRVEDDACQKAMEAETTYKSCVVEANERQLSLEKVKGEVLQQVRELIYQCDQTMKAVTVGYFQLQHTISAPAPVQFQTLCESSRLYEPGTQYMEFVKRLPQPAGSGVNGTLPFAFEPFSSDNRLDKVRRSNGSAESSEDILSHNFLEPRFSTDSKEKHRVQAPIKAWGSATQPPVGSDSDSMSSCPSNKSQDTSPAASPHISTRKVMHVSSGDELETDHDNVDTFGQARRPCISKAAETHTFRKLKTPSRCRECDSYVYFHGFECFECGLASHKKCLESLAIQCGRKRLPRKMTTFGVDLTTHANESGEDVPYIVNKCIAEIEDKGFCLKGIYRVSGVKSKVEKLCQSFENGAELVDLDGVHPNVVSNVLKLYLRQLPEPLLTYKLYPEFIKIAKDYPSQKSEEILAGNGAVENLQKLTQRLPGVHFATLACLMHHLHRVSEHADHNNMPPSNLGIVFGPTLLRTSEGSASLSSLVDTVHQTRVIELLISHSYEIFGPPHNQPSSQQDDSCLRKERPKSARYRGEKQIVSRTISGSSQASDVEELQQLETDNRRDGMIDADDYPIPGYLPADKSQEMEISHQSSDITHSSDDLLYSNVISDDDFPEILLSDDSVFKKSPVSQSILNQYSEIKSNDESLKSSQSQSHIRVQDARASLSSSPAVSEASHCSSLLRSTDDESISDVLWKEALLPVPPPRKSAPSNLQLNQSFLHGSLERKQGTSSVSESSGVSSAASTSPTGAIDTSQSDPGNLYTSTAVVTFAGQKSPPGSRTSTSSITAELRRQFFDLPPVSSGNQQSNAESCKDSGCSSQQSSLPDAQLYAKSLYDEKTADELYEESKQESNFCPECQEEFCSCISGYTDINLPSQCEKDDYTPQRYISPIASSYRSRGSSLHFSNTVTSSSSQEKEERTCPNSEAMTALRIETASVDHQNFFDPITKFSERERPGNYQSSVSRKSESCEKSEVDSNRKSETISTKHVQNVGGPSRSLSLESESMSSTSVISTKRHIETAICSGSFVSDSTQQIDRTARGSEKLSPNRQPRFV